MLSSSAFKAWSPLERGGAWTRPGRRSGPFVPLLSGTTQGCSHGVVTLVVIALFASPAALERLE